MMALALGLFAASPVVAQQQSDSAARAAQIKERLAKIAKQLNLTPQQSEQLKPIIQQEVADLRTVKDKHKGDTTHAGRESMAKEMMGVREKYVSQVNAVLTPEQQAQWKAMQEKKKAKKEKHHKPA